MPREIETLDGRPYGLAAARWTSTSGRWGVRAPFAGRGLGEVYPQILREDKPDEDRKLELTVFVLSQGAYDPERYALLVHQVLSTAGYRIIEKPTATSYPLKWSWEYDGPNKLYEAKPVGEVGPFSKVSNLPGSSGFVVTGRSPTSEDSAKLPSQGTVLVFPKIEVPPDGDMGKLLNALRVNRVKATSNSNIVSAAERLRLYSVPRSRAFAVAGLGLAFALGLAFFGGGAAAKKG
jgi:hypothetical protein